MTLFLAILKAVLTLAACFAIVAFFMWRSLKKSDDPGRLIFKWILTGILAVGLFVTALYLGQTPILPGIAAAFGVVLGILWAPHLAAILAKPLTNLFEGGDDPEPVPLYSMAEARRKQGRYAEAIAAVREQLEKFPTDFKGWMLLAEIQAENQLNITGARDTIDEFLSQPGHAPRNIAFALNRCADWELKFRQDRAAARRALERVIELLPETEQAQVATQRIAHLTDSESAPTGEPQRIALKRGDNRLGLRVEPDPLTPAPMDDPAPVAAEYLKRLEESPNDSDTREKLAVLYAERFQRLDLAEHELEQLITIPHQPPKQTVRWLNTLADLQIKHGADTERARQTLQRVIDLFPKTAQAENALNRMAYLNLQARGQQKSQAVKLGSYEKNLGLK